MELREEQPPYDPEAGWADGRVDNYIGISSPRAITEQKLLDKIKPYDNN